MKAARLEKLNEPLRVAEVPAPEEVAGEVLVELHAAALNRRDVWIQAGQYARIALPLIPGSDGAGIVRSAGEWNGKEVILNPALNWGTNERYQSGAFEILGMPRPGTFAGSISVPVEQLAAKPTHLSWEEAAALPLAGLTAYRALFVRAGLRSGERVLITGAGGGVSAIAIAMAVAAGAEVWVTSSSEEKIAAAQALGARGGVNYKNENWMSEWKKAAGAADVILDGTGGSSFAALAEVAAQGGRIAIYGGTRGNIEGLSPQRIFWKQLTICGSTMGSPADFQAMLAFVNEKKVKPPVDLVFPLDEAEAAMRRLEAAQQFGKIVLKIK